MQKKERIKQIVKIAEIVAGGVGYIIIGSYAGWHVALGIALIQTAHILKRHSRV